MQGDGPGELAAQFRSFSAAAGRDGARLYQRISLGVADDPELLDLAAVSPPEQRRPNLLLAAVHFLLLGGDDHPLGDRYPTVGSLRSASWPARPSAQVATPGAVARVADDDPFPDFRDLCLSRRATLAELVATRATQTNEIGRSAALLPGLAAASAACGGGPLSLLDLGASAGLNLLFDRYAYDYGGGLRAGDPDAAVVLQCELRHGHPDLRPPTVACRAGLDHRPVDPTDETSARWLLACLWPDQLARFERLRAALELAGTQPNRPRVLAGDMVDQLPAAAAAAPLHVPLCVFHSWAAAYLTPARQAALAATIGDLARDRAVVWLFAEEPSEVPGLPVPPAPPEGRRGATALVLTTFDGGHTRSRRLADMHPHGRWLRWWACGASC
jgi:hypothetical protein